MSDRRPSPEWQPKAVADANCDRTATTLIRSSKFDKNELAFLYQQEQASGEDSTFFKLVSRD